MNMRGTHFGFLGQQIPQFHSVNERIWRTVGGLMISSRSILMPGAEQGLNHIYTMGVNQEDRRQTVYEGSCTMKRSLKRHFETRSRRKLTFICFVNQICRLF